MADTSHRTTAEQQAVKRAKARAETRAARKRVGIETAYVILHGWLPRSTRRRATR